ncbi:MAG TPA: GreA/GreB family elongation factor, partial [Candidatus Competibacter sp.]|nr:GreA/GreB family elongation factor [Candidatus Competibacter sp.]
WNNTTLTELKKWEEQNDALEEFFVKNIETIQGDERDVMMISTLYGPEAPGAKVLQRFGPINSAHGHRRLNVLFTRAKRKIVTFTSMKPTDILVDGNKALGVRMFRAWLEYSKTGHIQDVAGQQGGTESPFEDYVAAQIERLGCEVVPQVGVAGFRIDLGLRHPDWPYGYILGVECDGAAYHSSKSSRDRDRLRQEVLEGLGWRLHRIWSTDWFRNPRAEIEALKRAIEDALADAKARGVKHSERLDAMTLLTRLAEDTRSNVEEPPAQARAETRPGAAASAASGRPEQASLSFEPPAGSDLFTAASRVATEPTIALGSKVKVESMTDGKKLAFTLVEGQNAPDDGKIGLHTPLGQALLDAQVGDEVEYQVGSHIKEVRVLEIR